MRKFIVVGNKITSGSPKCSDAKNETNKQNKYIMSSMLQHGIKYRYENIWLGPEVEDDN